MQHRPLPRIHLSPRSRTRNTMIHGYEDHFLEQDTFNHSLACLTQLLEEDAAKGMVSCMAQNLIQQHSLNSLFPLANGACLDLTQQEAREMQYIHIF